MPVKTSLCGFLGTNLLTLTKHQNIAFQTIFCFQVYVHPFVDGNGRTSRLLMNLILMQNGFPPVIVRKQDRLLYYQHLVTANDGDIRRFIRFIADCAENTLDAYLLATKENSLVPFTSDDNENIIAVQVSCKFRLSF